MDGVSAATIGRMVGEGGIYGLGWLLFIFMMFREIRERKRYSDLVIHIISYFTKVNMVERQTDEVPLIPPELFGIRPSPRKGKRVTRRGADPDDDES